MSQIFTNLQEFRLLLKRDRGVMAAESEFYGFNIGQTDLKVDTVPILTDGSYKCAYNVQELVVLVGNVKCD
jgi:hypothetical protein